MKPGSRPKKSNWCEWLQAITQWTHEQRQMSREKADRAYASRSIRAQYAALGEMRALDMADEGTLVHRNHCADRRCPEG